MYVFYIIKFQNSVDHLLWVGNTQETKILNISWRNLAVIMCVSSRGRLYDVSKEDWNGSGNMAKILV